VAVTLSDIPTAGADLEHFVAALFQSSGYYVEKNLVERDPSDILELDIVATSYRSGGSASVLVEAKGGAWGWTDLFKMLGWMKYLGFEQSALFAVAHNDRPLTAIAEKLGPHGVQVVYMDDFADPAKTFVDAGFDACGGDPSVVRVWRHAFDVEARLTTHCVSVSKESGAPQASKEIVRYMHLTNNGTFFARNTIDRIHMLYDAYRAHPKLALAASLELDGEVYNPDPPTISSFKLDEALRDGAHTLIQGAMYAEHRARLALLKAAVDYLIESPLGPPSVALDSHDWSALLHEFLPESFRTGMDWLRAQPTFHRYAVFWQQLLWGWGGFYLTHMKHQEFSWMAELSGVPESEIPTALETFDHLFPISGGWFVTAGPTSVSMVKMMPVPFRGIGAHNRRQHYGWMDAAGYSAVGGAQYTGNDLVKWNNAAYKLLTA